MSAAHFSVLAPERFDEQMKFLYENDFTSLTISEYKKIVIGDVRPNKLSVLVTFDDAYSDNLRVAWPIAQRYGIKINIFCPTSLVGLRHPVFMCEEVPAILDHCAEFPDLWQPLSWHEVREMYSLGVSFGLHGHSHQNMALMAPDILDSEIRVGARIFKEQLGHYPEAVALPYGGPGAYSPEVLETLRRAGLDLVFSTIVGRSHLPSRRMPMRRIVVHENDSLDFFKMKVFGYLDFIGHFRLVQQKLRRFDRRSFT